jgi:hypothetical protein
MKYKQTKRHIKTQRNKNFVFGKINKIDRSLESLIKMRRGKTQISKIRNAKGERTTNTTEI